MLEFDAYDDGIGQIIIESAEDNELTPRSYSGRGMYGKYCFGITGYLSDIPAFVASVTQQIMEDEELSDQIDPVDLFENMNSDSMGMESIFYWTHLKINNIQED